MTAQFRGSLNCCGGKADFEVAKNKDLRLVADAVLRDGCLERSREIMLTKGVVCIFRRVGSMQW